MRIPPHWVKERAVGTGRDGAPVAFSAWGWSMESLAAAREMAAARARKVLALICAGQQPQSYDYLEHPLREEVVEAFRRDEAEIAAITRNRYGALVLNTARVAFVDVDFPPPSAGGFFAALAAIFSARRRQQREREQEDAAVLRVKTWARSDGRRSLRIYRTAAGLRLLLTDRPYEPEGAETASIFRELGSDPLYRRLTEKQQCFRARLTPKPWRIDCARPPQGFPWMDVEQERVFREWQRGYEAASAGRVACRHLLSVGEGVGDEEIRAVVELHDRLACGLPQAELA